MKLALSIATVLVLAATAGAAAPRSVTSEAPVSALALGTVRMAYAADRTSPACDRVYIWHRASGRRARLAAPGVCEEGSTGSGIARLAIAGTRVLWLSYVGGNIREWSLLTATTTAPKPRVLAYIARDVDAPAPIVVGAGDSSRYGETLPYAVDTQVIVLSSTGRRVFAWRAPARVTALGAAAGGLAVAAADGSITTLENGSVVAKWSGSPAATAVFVTGNGVAAQRHRTIELRTGDGSTRRVTVEADARLLDASGSRAVYTTRGRVKLLNLETGAASDLGAGRLAELEGLTAAVASGRAIRFVRVR